MAVRADVVVIGAGAVGSAAAWRLAARGARVVALDRFPAGHEHGSSHGHTRIIRMAYFEHPDYVPLLRRAYLRWDELETARSERLFFRVGLLEVGRPDGPTVQGILTSARLHDLPVETLDADAARRRFPAFVVPPECVAIFEANAGYLLVERCVEAMQAEAVRAGATLVVGETVVDWSADASGVVVRTDRENYHADRLIVAAGPYTNRLLAERRVSLTVERKHLYWFGAGPEHGSGCPAFYFETDAGAFYGFPDVAGRGAKAAEHGRGRVVADPLADDRGPDPADAARVERFMAASLPSVVRPARARAVCWYTMSPDGHFVIDQSDASERVVFAAGLSGHGFKFAPALGDALCDLTLEGRSSLPIEFLGASRFGPQAT